MSWFPKTWKDWRDFLGLLFITAVVTLTVGALAVSCESRQLSYRKAFSPATPLPERCEHIARGGERTLREINHALVYGNLEARRELQAVMDACHNLTND